MSFSKEKTKRKSPGGGGKDSSFHKNNNKKQKNDGKAWDDGMSSSSRKREMRKWRQGNRRHADCVTEAKVLWNKLRLKTNTKEDTRKLMDKVMELLRGKVQDIALQHDASRVVQAAIQFGNDDERKELLTEICQTEGSLAEMARIQYAHFVCLKFIKYCARDDASIKMIVKVRTHVLVAARMRRQKGLGCLRFRCCNFRLFLTLFYFFRFAAVV